MIIFLLACVLYAVAVSVGEAWCERDWPRVMLRYVVWYGVLFVVAVCAFGQEVR